MNELVYDKGIQDDFQKLHIEHQWVINHVGQNKKILEVGCNAGYVSYWLQKNNNQVTGLEMGPLALEKAGKYLHRKILGNVEDEQVWDQVKAETYDVILYMHVLEHLVDPWKVLRASKKLLNEGGFIIVCLPNISNFNTRWELMKGNFDYEDVGVMDRTHLRFFNIKTAYQFIEDCGFNVVDYFSPWQTSFKVFPKRMVWINQLIVRSFRKVASRNLTDIVMSFKLVPTK